MPKEGIMSEEENKQIIHAVSIKPGIFKETAVTGWFLTLEAQFSLNKITSESTRFFHVLAALPPELATNLPEDVAASQNYTQLKKTVIDIYEQTKPEMFDKLINKTTLSGRPSIFLQELNSLAKKVGVGEDLIRHKFVNALPSNIAPVLAAQKTLSLTQLGVLADELMPLLSEQVSHVPITAVNNSDFSPRRRNDQRYSRSKSPKNESNMPYGLKPYNQNQRPKVCKAHLYYGKSARTCKQWCHWPQKNDCKILPNSRSSSPAPSEN